MAPPPDPNRHALPVRYGLAVVVATLAAAMSFLVDVTIGPRQSFLGGNLAAVIVAYFFGIGPAVVALLVGTTIFFLFVVPRVDLATNSFGPVVVTALSFCSGGVLIWLVDQLQRSRRAVLDKAESASTAEARLRERDIYLREFLDHTSAVVYLKGLDGRLLLVNHRDEALFPRMDDVPRGDGGESSFPPEAEARFSKSDSEVLASGMSQTFEETVHALDGVHSYVTVKFPILDDQRKIVAVGGVSTDVTELHNARADLERKERVLRNLIEVQEQEKQLLCGEFHDGLIQYAVGAKMMLESLPRALLPEHSSEAIDAAIGCLARGIEDGRRVIHGIRPAELDDLGLDAAIQTLVGDLEGTGIDVEATIEPIPADTPPAFQVTVYRIVQEAFSNVRRHSGSARARLDLRREGKTLLLRLEDFGNGGSSECRDHQGFGITGMQERARLVGGDCEVEFRPGRGTVVTARLPLPPTEGDGRQEPSPARARDPGGDPIPVAAATPL